jgi:Glyoxalase/Bleomycin resistance protein/Dioxygenase superfamily
MRHWVETCGVGPWFYTEKFAFKTFSYGGQRHDDLNISVAMANSGEMQIELIQQYCRTPSMYRDFLEASGEGLRHWAAWPDNYDDAYARTLASRYEIG